MDFLTSMFAIRVMFLVLKEQTNCLLTKGQTTKGVPEFIEQAQAVGLADSAFSNQAAFFDYDIDGDLDMVLLNHSPVRFNNLDETAIQYLLNKNDSLTGLKFYKNNKGLFTEVSNSIGVKNSRLNFNLGVSISDVNNDGLQDMYISNDYFAPDYLYINNGDGTFKSDLDNRITSTSQFSMGNDIADINNDGWSDIYTLDMLPEDNRRQKLLFGGDNFELFDMRVKAGLNAQYMRNMLHLNNGDGSFSEIGQLANVANTDWSWAPLIADLDNDGWKDLFVTNGYLRDYTNLDFLKYLDNSLRESQGNLQKSNLLELVKKMPASDVKNYSFKNERGLQFNNTSAAWGLGAISNSNGAAYSDLDNDGDLDLVVNNINKAAFVYKNNTDKIEENGFLSVKLVGEGGNTFGLGAKVQLFIKGEQQLQEVSMSRGFQSSVSPVMIFGTGKSKMIDSLKVTWPGKKQQVVVNITCNQKLVLKQEDAKLILNPEELQSDKIFLFRERILSYTHKQTQANDFKRQPLLVNALSYSGPVMAKGDVDGDGKEDLFIGGSAGFAGGVFIQKGNQIFEKINEPALEADAASEDAGAVFFDANADGKTDLFVASGGYDFFEPGDGALQSRLYLNDGSGNFKRAQGAIPEVYTSSGAVAVGDVNNDGFKDLFLGGRVIPGRYPETPFSYIFINNGKGIFRDATTEVCPTLQKAGMITAAVFADMDGDKKEELITAGEWLPVQIWKQMNGKLVDRTLTFMDLYCSGMVEYTGCKRHKRRRKK